MISAHNEAYKKIKSVGEFKVGIVKQVVWYETYEEKPYFWDSWLAKFMFWLNCDFFLKEVKKYSPCQNSQKKTFLKPTKKFPRKKYVSHMKLAKKILLWKTKMLTMSLKNMV